MCGIVGIADFQRVVASSRDRVIAMNDAIRARGPDGEGIFQSADGAVTLGARLLSIVDPGRTQQPFQKQIGDHTYCIAFNGELYNYRELRKELEDRGHAFASNCDTEVALASYVCWGDKCLERFNGAFAFAVYDAAHRQVFLARDRVGIRPLFYHLALNGTLSFASEPKAILANASVKAKADITSIATFLLEMNLLTDGAPPPDRSFFEGVASLLPGSFAVFDANGLRLNQYWSLPFCEDSTGRCFDDYVDEMLRLLRHAVQIRVPESVGFGVALSGGVDSSLVATLAAEYFNGPIPCFTMYYEDARNPDADAAAILARWHKLLLHKSVNLTTPKLLSAIDPMIRAMDSPHDTIRQLGMFEMYRSMADAKLKVALVGEGADEFNLGYFYTSPGFNQDLAICQTSDQFRQIWKSRLESVVPLFTGDVKIDEVCDNVIEDTVRRYYDACPVATPLHRMQYYYANKFLKYRLDANDRCGFAHGLEVRVPFCDHSVIAASLAIPSVFNLQGISEKRVLRGVGQRLLPKEISLRPKFPMPESPRLDFHEALGAELQQRIEETSASVWNIIDRSYVDSVAKRYRRTVQTLIKDGADNADALVGEIKLVDKMELRTKHAFSALTLLRWFDMYIGN